MWRRIAGTVLPKPFHEPIYRGSEVWPPLSRGVRKGTELLIQRGVHVAHALECLIEALSADIGIHPDAPLGRQQTSGFLRISLWPWGCQNIAN